MGSYVFKWDHPATEVFVTGTFDDWTKSIKLDNKTGNLHEKEVALPSAEERVLYKYVVDGNWTYDHTKPTERDGLGNTNNVLPPEQITKVTSDLPGAFPETPAAGADEVKVNPLPATAGIGNPVSTRPGEGVPAISSITSNTIQSGVTLDKKSYENSGGAPPQLDNPITPEAEREAAGGMFGLPELSKNMIPESSLPITGGSGVNTIQSVGAGATTAQLAGQVPKEPRGEATVVGDNPNIQSVGAGSTTTELAGEVPKEPRGKATAVGDDPTIQSVGAGSTTAQLAGDVPKEPRSETSVVDDAKKESSANIQTVGAGATTAQLAGQVPKEPRGQATVVGDGATTIQSVGAGATTAKLAGEVPKESRGVPEVVQDSQKEANVAPEASSNPEAVKEKAAVESELEKKVPEQPAASESTITGKAAGIAAGAAAGATAVAGAAAAYFTSGQAKEDAKASVPETVKDKLPESVKDKVASNGSTTAPIASAVPEPVQESIKQSHQSPEAAASAAAVKEKSAVESELLKKVPAEQAAGTPAVEAAKAAALATEAPKPMMKSTEQPLSDTKADNSKSTADPIAGANNSKSTAAPISQAENSKSTAAPTTPSKSSGGAMAAALGDGKNKSGPDSRDISPMTRPGESSARPTQPMVTTGVASSSTPTKSTAAGSPVVAGSPASQKTDGTDKKHKRRSGFFEKLKHIAHRHKKDEK